MEREGANLVPFKDVSSASECEEFVVLLERFAAALDAIRSTLPRSRSTPVHGDEAAAVAAVAATEELRAAVEATKRRLAIQGLLYLANVDTTIPSFSQSDDLRGLTPETNELLASLMSSSL